MRLWVRPRGGRRGSPDAEFFYRRFDVPVVRGPSDHLRPRTVYHAVFPSSDAVQFGVPYMH